MTKEKRHYIRVCDRIFIRYHRLSKQEFENKIKEYEQGKKQPWIDPLHPPGETRKWESLLKKLRERDRELAGLFEILEQKLDRILVNLLGPKCLKGFIKVEADISGGGLKVILSEELGLGDIFELDIGLVPEWYFFRAYGEVIRTKKHGDKYEVAFKFIWITEADQDRLVQHVFRQQLLQLQAQKRVHKA